MTRHNASQLQAITATTPVIPANAGAPLYHAMKLGSGLRRNDEFFSWVTRHNASQLQAITATTPVIPANAGTPLYHAMKLGSGLRRNDEFFSWVTRHNASQLQAITATTPVIPANAGTPLFRDSWMKYPCVYLLASRWNGTLYVGVTSNLVKRVWEHQNDVIPGFTRRYRVHNLVWFEQHATMDTAIAREKAIKEWKRAWKIDLIEKDNPDWRDLYPGLI